MSILRIFIVGFLVFLLIMVIYGLLSRFYTLPCPAWLGWLVELDNPFTSINRAATIIEHLNLQPGMTVVDIGCGPGRLTIPLAKKVGPTGRVVALDIQEDMLQKVRQKAQKEKLNNITFLHAGIGEQKLESSLFDYAVLVTVLGEIPNREAALQEIFNALKPGGILSITEVIFDPHFQRQNTILELTNRIGFIQKKIYGSWWAFTINLQKPIEYK